MLILQLYYCVSIPEEEILRDKFAGRFDGIRISSLILKIKLRIGYRLGSHAIHNCRIWLRALLSMVKMAIKDLKTIISLINKI